MFLSHKCLNTPSPCVRAPESLVHALFSGTGGHAINLCEDGAAGELSDNEGGFRWHRLILQTSALCKHIVSEISELDAFMCICNITR